MQISYKLAVRRFLAALTRMTPVSESLRSMSTRGLLPDSLYRRLPVERSFHVQVPGTKGFNYTSLRRDGVGRDLYWRGIGHDGTTIREFSSRCERASVVLDIGANSGLFTLLACTINPKTQVIAFEPAPEVRLQLEANVKANGFENRCDIRSEAASDSNGTASLHLPHESWTSASLNADGYHGLAGNTITIKTVTVDSIADASLTVDLIKIDVEGFEDKVLDGMQKTVSRCAPVIILECNAGGPASALNAFLSRNRYECSLLGEELRQAAQIDPALDRNHFNWLCSPRT
jgi:FkbM family methyltransferase